MTYKEMAEKYGVTQGTISYVIKRSGIEMKGYRKGNRNSRYKGRFLKNSYMVVRVSENHPFISMAHKHSSAYESYCIPEHRLVMAEHLGRALDSDETVHHINGDKLDNRIENLQLLRRNQHRAGQNLVCVDCGSNNINSVEMEI